MKRTRKLDWQTVGAIRTAKATGATVQQLATRFGITERTVYHIVFHHTWHDPGYCPPPKNKPGPRPGKFSEHHISALLALANSPAPGRYARWTCALLAQTLIKKGIVHSIAPSSVHRILRHHGIQLGRPIYRVHTRPTHRRVPTSRWDERQVAAIVALSQQPPPPGHSRWSLRLLAQHLVESGVVESISHESVRQILRAHKKGAT